MRINRIKQDPDLSERMKNALIKELENQINSIKNREETK